MTLRTSQILEQQRAELDQQIAAARAAEATTGKIYTSRSAAQKLAIVAQGIASGNMAAVAREHGLHESQLSKWKQKALGGLAHGVV